MAEIIKLGSLYFDGQPQEVGSKYNNGQITFGPAVPGKELQWFKINGILVADRCVCTCVSWEQLDDQDLVFGTLARIDGQFYLCRCLKVGTDAVVPSEWNTALNEIGKNNMIWHWKNQYFWGQETLKGQASHRAVRGYSSARFWNDLAVTTRRAYVGFRPALEPLGPEPCSPDALIGKTIRLYGARGVPLEGRLLDVDDYDLILTPVTGTPTDCSWASRAGENLVVSRDSVLWAKEV